WFEEGGVVHVRPKGARAEADNFLNTVVPTFTLTDATLRQILDAYRGAFTGKPLATPTSIGSGASLLRGDDRTTLAARQEAWRSRRISLSLSASTVSQVLDAVILARGDAYWQIDYSQAPATFETSTLMIGSFQQFDDSTAARQPEPASRQAGAAALALMQPTSGSQTDGPPLERRLLGGGGTSRPSASDFRVPMPVTPARVMETATNIAKATRVVMGIEGPRMAEPRVPDAGAETLGLGGMKVSDALYHLLAACPHFAWRQNGDVIEVYSKPARDDATNFLNRVVAHYEVRSAAPGEALSELQRTFDPSLPVFRTGVSASAGQPAGNASKLPGGIVVTRSPAPGRITLSLDNVTARQILNAIVAAVGDAIWIVEFAPDGYGYQGARITVRGHGGWGLTAGGPMR
ncbi:MAG: hypothetical protein ACM3NQ_20935, partial [Bacteroidales bacterium]